MTTALPSLTAAAPPGVRVGGYANGFQTTTSGVCGCTCGWRVCIAHLLLAYSSQLLGGVPTFHLAGWPLKLQCVAELRCIAPLQSGWRAAAAQMQHQ